MQCHELTYIEDISETYAIAGHTTDSFPHADEDTYDGARFSFSDVISFSFSLYFPAMGKGAGRPLIH